MDIVSTTLAGYTGDRVKTDGPDLELLREVVAVFDVPVICGGRVHTPEAGRHKAGAFAVIVGTAITHPTSITTWFKAALWKADLLSLRRSAGEVMNIRPRAVLCAVT